jgi:hypothetical protein
VDKWYSNIQKWVESFSHIKDKYILCDDVRFDSEAKRIKSLGGTIIEIVGRQLDLGENSNHASEQGISPNLIDETIDNSENFQNLFSQCYSILQKYRF